MESKTGYVLFSGQIDPGAVSRIFNAIAAATQSGITDIHMLINSTGGFVPDGICLYNFFRTVPLNLTLYNAGAVQSIAAISFLGAKRRLVAQHASFMIHGARAARDHATAEIMESAARSLRMDNTHIVNILQSHIIIPPNQAALHETSDLWITANESLEYGLAHEIGDFSPPFGQPIYNI